MNNFFKRVGLGVIATVSAVPAFAAVDVSAVVSEITAAIAPVGLIGGAVLMVMVTAAVYKWVRKAL